MQDSPIFDHCDAEHVFGEVEKRVDSPQLRTLWHRLHSELRRTNVGAALTYLDGEFARLTQEFARELDRAQSP